MNKLIHLRVIVFGDFLFLKFNSVHVYFSYLFFSSIVRCVFVTFPAYVWI